MTNYITNRSFNKQKRDYNLLCNLEKYIAESSDEEVEIAYRNLLRRIKIYNEMGVFDYDSLSYKTLLDRKRTKEIFDFLLSKKNAKEVFEFDIKNAILMANYEMLDLGYASQHIDPNVK